jgi:hypothetical protein
MHITPITPGTSAFPAIKPAAGATVQHAESKSAAAPPPPAGPPAEAPAAQAVGTASQTIVKTTRALEQLYGLPGFSVAAKPTDTSPDDSSAS